MNGAGARRKGVNFEREIASRLREVFNSDDVRRGLQYRDGAEAPDVICPLFHVECKRGRRTSPKKALEQAVRDCTKGKTPIAITKDDRCDAMVTMLLEDFLDWLKDYWCLQSK